MSDCGSCKHWDQEVAQSSYRDPVGIEYPWDGGRPSDAEFDRQERVRHQIGSRFGHCTAITQGWDHTEAEAAGLRAVAWDGSEFRADVYTRDDFGCVLHEPRGDPVPGACPDGGTCHHACTRSCFRVDWSGPLSGVYPNDEWPADVVAANATADRRL